MEGQGARAGSTQEGEPWMMYMTPQQITHGPDIAKTWKVLLPSSPSNPGADKERRAQLIASVLDDLDRS